MSVIIPATANDGLQSNSNLSNPQSFTKLIWALFPSSPTSLEELIWGTNSGITSFAGLFPVQFNSGKLSVATGVSVGSDGFATQPTWTNWNCFAISGTTAGAGSLIGYWQPNSGGGFISHAVTGVNFTNSSDRICTGTMPLATTVAFYKEWNVVLTPTQLQAEFLSALPVITGASLARYLALANTGTAGTDTSGNGFNMTVTGTLSNGASLPTFPATAITASGVSGSSGAMQLGNSLGVIQAPGASASYGIALASSQTMLGTGSGSMGVASLFSSTPGSIFFAQGPSGSVGVVSLTGAGALVGAGVSGSTATLSLTGNTALQLVGLSASGGISAMFEINPGGAQALGFSGSSGTAFLALPTGPMPNLSGQLLDDALEILQQVGFLNPQKLGYFGTYPVTVIWVPSKLPPSTVISQSVTFGSKFTVNMPITLTVSEFPISTAFP